ncbi:retrotransposon gag domain, retroviral aspartyl protease [Tanacetum coccineum]
MSDMTACLNDLGYIPLNTEQIEPTQGVIGETSNDLTQAKRNELQRLYKSSHSAKEMTWHATGKCTEPGKMQYPIDGRAWKDFDTMILTTYNLPPWLCMKESSFMLTLLIPGPKSPGKDIDVYLRPLIDNLKDLWAKPGVETIDVALTFSSHYFWDGTTKFNRPNRNVDFPPPTCQFQVFKSLCKSIGLRSVIRIDHQELKKVIWYVLHNSPEIDTYQAKFKSEFPNKDMKEEFPGWFRKQIRQSHVDNDLGVSESSELFALACGPSQTPISVNSCVVNVQTTTQLEGHKKFSNGGVIVVEDDPGVIHVNNSSDLALSTSLNDMEITALHIDGQSIDVDAPLDIIDVMSADVARGHGGDGGGDDRPPHTRYPLVRAPKNPIWVAGEQAGCIPRDPHASRDHAAHLANYLGELVRELSLHHPSWCQVPPEQKRGVRANIGTQFDIRPHMNLIAGHKSMRPSRIIYKRSTMARMLLLRKGIGFLTRNETYDLERIRQTRPSHISEVDWDAKIAFWNDLKNLARAAQNKQNRAKSKVSGTFPELVRVFVGIGTIIPPRLQAMHSFEDSPATLKKREKMLTKKMNMLMKLFRSDVKFSQMLTLLESQPEYDGGSGSGGCGDDEPGDDEDGGKDEEDEDDS